VFLLKSGFTPGELESGISFYGRDGEVVSKACSALENIRFEFVYGTACHKCHADDFDEADLDCSDFISIELRIVRPRIILAMGSRAFAVLQEAGYTGREQVYVPGKLIKSNFESMILMTSDISEALSSEEMKKAFWSHLKLLDRSYKHMLSLLEKNNPLK
jgi:uracil-DNA glycosylase